MPTRAVRSGVHAERHRKGLRVARAALRVLLAFEAIMAGTAIGRDDWDENDMEFARRSNFANLALALQRYNGRDAVFVR